MTALTRAWRNGNGSSLCHVEGQFQTPLGPAVDTLPTLFLYTLPDFLFSFFAMRRCNRLPSSSGSLGDEASGAISGGSWPALVYLSVSLSSFLFFHSSSDK